MELRTLLILLGLFGAFFALVVAFLLITFSQLRHIPQPSRLFLFALGSGAVTALFWLPATLFGVVNGMGCVVAFGITFIGGATISVFGSGETISQKMKDEPFRKSDDGSGNWTIP